MVDYVRKAKRWTRIEFDGNADNLRAALATEAPNWGTQVYEDSTNGAFLVNFVLGGTQVQLSIGSGWAIYVPVTGGESPEAYDPNSDGSAFEVA